MIRIKSFLFWLYLPTVWAEFMCYWFSFLQSSGYKGFARPLWEWGPSPAEPCGPVDAIAQTESRSVEWSS